MNANTITTLISTLGFPIVMCGVLIWYLNKQEERHAAEVKALSTAIDNNTSVMQSLIAKLD